MRNALTRLSDTQYLRDAAPIYAAQAASEERAARAAAEHDDRLARLRALIAEGLSLQDAIGAFHQPADEMWIDAARKHTNDEMEIDDKPATSASDEGCWVSAWVWVPLGAVWKGEADDYGAACRLRNHYHCDDCDESWTDDWSCACDDKCPKCGKAIMPHDSVELGWDGEPVPVELVAEGAQ